MLKDLLINNLAPGEVDRTGERVDGKATIIGKLGYNWIAVLDAAYRANSLPFGKYGINLPGLQANSTGGIFLSSTTTPADILTQASIDQNSSKVNTAYLKTQNSGKDTSSPAIIGVPAAVHCFNTQIAGTTAQLGNIQTMAFVCLRKDFIDANDPTVEANIDKSLLRGISNVYMSSTTYVKGDSPNIWAINSDTNQTTSIVRWGAYPHQLTIPILEIPAYEDRTGERVDGKATIIGRLGENWIAVLDAEYRGEAQYRATTSDITSGIPNNNGRYSVSNISTEEDILAQELYDIHSAKWNTDYLNQVQDATNFPAAKLCYDIIIDGQHAQLPNIQELAFINAKKEYIDANDPTTSAYPNNSFSKRSGYYISSSGGIGVSTVSGGYFSNTPSFNTVQNNISSSTNYSVCPILEIPLYKNRTGERVDDKATIVGKLGNYWIAVLDAEHRGTNIQWDEETGTSFKSTLIGTQISFIYEADEAYFLNNQFKHDSRTSKSWTEQLNARPASNFCLNTILSGVFCSLPNIQTMSFIRSWQTWLDYMDPTASTNADTKLTNADFTLWTANPDGTSVTSAFLTGTNLSMASLRTQPKGVCPILEIPLWCDDNYK